jgi:hypothetical protein
LISSAAANRTCSRRTRSAAVSPPPSGHLMSPTYRTPRQPSARLVTPPLKIVSGESGNIEWQRMPVEQDSMTKRKVGWHGTARIGPANLSIQPPSVPCQINRPGMMPLTWAGLIDWQTIMARRPVESGSRPQLSSIFAIATDPEIRRRGRPRIGPSRWQDTSRGRDRPGNRANFDGRTTQRAALRVNGPIYVSRDTVLVPDPAGRSRLPCMRIRWPA